MRKLLITVAVLSAFSTSALAETQAKEPTKRDFCKSHSELIGKVMHARQAGVPLSRILEILDDGSALSELEIEMALMAYGKPRYSTERMQERAIQEFANNAMLLCMKHFKGD